VGDPQWRFGGRLTPRDKFGAESLTNTAQTAPVWFSWARLSTEQDSRLMACSHAYMVACPHVEKSCAIGHLVNGHSSIYRPKMVSGRS
jgi:hypothetical protein